MRVLMPGRILDRHVGGNTTYARRLADGLAAEGVTVDRMPYGRHPLLTAYQETRTATAAGEPGDVLHYTADTGPLRDTVRPSAVTVHGVASRWAPGVRSPLAERIWRGRVAQAIRHCDRVLTVSQAGARDVAAVFGIPEESITVIPHGIDHARFSAPEVLSPELAERVPERFALYVGNIEPRKNIADLVRAFDRPELRELDLPLLIAGKPAWGFEEALALIERADTVHNLGFVSESDKIALMQRCTLFVFPSRYEGFGFPVLEAMAAGAPVVTSREGALAEVAGPAWELPGLDPAAIAAGVRSAALAQEWLTMSRSTGPQWAGTFHWEQSIAAHLAVYRELAG